MEQERNFSTVELSRRSFVQKEMQLALDRLRSALSEGRYSEALLINIIASNLLRSLINEGIALENEEAMLPVLQRNIYSLLHMPHMLN